jgi:linoleoyl-CoA desaturase
MHVERLSFPSDDRVLRELKRRVRQHFTAGRRSDKANASMVLRTFTMLGLTGGAYALILTNRVPPLGMLALAMLIGIGIAGIGFGVAHDALHGSYSRNPRVNRILGLTLDLCGGSSYMWRLGHNLVHHTYTNIPGIDGDVAGSSLLRQSPGSAQRPGHRYQHLYAFPLYTLATLNWVFAKDYKDIFESRWGVGPLRVHRRGDIAGMLGLKALHYLWTIVVPLMVLHVTWWQFLIGFMAMHLTAGAILGVVFQLAHIVEDAAFPQPGCEGAMPRSWLAHELDTTVNFANANRLLTWYVGGLNHQIEHHLFPRVCSTHYPEIRKIVHEVALANGLPYLQYPSVFQAIRSHYRLLKRLGEPAERPAAA